MHCKSPVVAGGGDGLYRPLAAAVKQVWRISCALQKCHLNPGENYYPLVLSFIKGAYDLLSNRNIWEKYCEEILPDPKTERKVGQE